MRTIGLTGGIATGKSTAAAILRLEHGIPVIDADKLAREVVVVGSPAHQEIVGVFGSEVLLEDGSLNRGALRKIISENPAARASLEAITHPRILARMAEDLGQLSAEGAPLAFVEAALLVETGSYAFYDALWVVTCSPALQLERLMARDGCSRHEALAMIATQLPLSEKEALADCVITNSEDRNSLGDAISAALLPLAG